MSVSRPSTDRALWVSAVLVVFLTATPLTAPPTWAQAATAAQPITLSTQSLEPLVSHFNTDKGKVRLLMLLSPT